MAQVSYSFLKKKTGVYCELWTITPWVLRDTTLHHPPQLVITPPTTATDDQQTTESLLTPTYGEAGSVVGLNIFATPESTSQRMIEAPFTHDENDITNCVEV